MNLEQSAQKHTVVFVKFVHNNLGLDGIIILVKPPIHYIVFATPHLRDTFSEKGSQTAAFFV